MGVYYHALSVGIRGSAKPISRQIVSTSAALSGCPQSFSRIGSSIVSHLSCLSLGRISSVILLHVPLAEPYSQ